MDMKRQREEGGNDLLTEPGIFNSAYALWDHKEGLHPWHRGMMHKLSRAVVVQDRIVRIIQGSQNSYIHGAGQAV